jgi:hypothetical protein
MEEYTYQLNNGVQFNYSCWEGYSLCFETRAPPPPPENGSSRTVMHGLRTPTFYPH